MAEILLNADDSYKRIEDETAKSKKRIDIYLDRDKREVTVIDRAEGMSKKELEEKFTLYGASHAGGEKYRVRGLFGQGASDVLFSSAMSKKKAEIKTIKDNTFQTCKFKFEKEKRVEIKRPKTHLKEIRKTYGINNNGTVVLFGLPDEVNLPPKKSIKKTLESFYMFRYI
ncbi:MAG: ATP-binding protein, partial [Bacillota bacterium]